MANNETPETSHKPVASREEIARIIDPVNFNLTPQTYGTDEEGFMRTFAYGAQIVALERADAVMAALKPRESEVGIPATPAPAELSVVIKAEAFDRIVAARKTYNDAVKAYNDRLAVVKAERERGNWGAKVDDEYAAMSEAQILMNRTVRDEAEIALSASEVEG